MREKTEIVSENYIIFFYYYIHAYIKKFKKKLFLPVL